MKRKLGYEDYARLPTGDGKRYEVLDGELAQAIQVDARAEVVTIVSGEETVRPGRAERQA